ncbi:MAG: ash family protein [Hafnia alvei]|uniref:ash family protein n=1 Tax=Hafnia alvei TaxID=569 RepID=UPI003F964397
MKLSSLLIVGIEIRMAFQCMSLAGTMNMHKSYSNEKAMSTNACSLCVIFVPNSHEYVMMIDSMNSESYSFSVAVNPATGLRIPEFSTAHSRVSGFFVCNAFACLSMVAQAGAPLGAPVSVEAGNANSVWATTNHGFASVGGSKYHSTEAAIMATIPTQAATKENLQQLCSVTSALRYLRAIELNNADKNNTLANTIELLTTERKTLVSIILPEIHRALGLHTYDKGAV